MSPVLGALGVGARAYGLTGATEVLPAFELISTSLPTSSPSSVTFSSIPQTYKHLRLHISGRSNYANPTDSFYVTLTPHLLEKVHALKGLGSTPTSSYSTSGDVGIMSGGSAGGGQFGGAIIDILNYTSTTNYPTIQCFSGWFSSTSSKGVQLSSAFDNYLQGATTSIVFGFLNGTIANGTRLSLYGVRG